MTEFARPVLPERILKTIPEASKVDLKDSKTPGILLRRMESNINGQDPKPDIFLIDLTLLDQSRTNTGHPTDITSVRDLVQQIGKDRTIFDSEWKGLQSTHLKLQEAGLSQSDREELMLIMGMLMRNAFLLGMNTAAERPAVAGVINQLAQLYFPESYRPDNTPQPQVAAAPSEPAPAAQTAQEAQPVMTYEDEAAADSLNLTKEQLSGLPKPELLQLIRNGGLSKRQILMLPANDRIREETEAVDRLGWDEQTEYLRNMAEQDPDTLAAMAIESYRQAYVIAQEIADQTSNGVIELTDTDNPYKEQPFQEGEGLSIDNLRIWLNTTSVRLQRPKRLERWLPKIGDSMFRSRVNAPQRKIDDVVNRLSIGNKEYYIYEFLSQTEPPEPESAQAGAPPLSAQPRVSYTGITTPPLTTDQMLAAPGLEAPPAALDIEQFATSDYDTLLARRNEWTPEILEAIAKRNSDTFNNLMINGDLTLNELLEVGSLINEESTDVHIDMREELLEDESFRNTDLTPEALLQHQENFLRKYLRVRFPYIESEGIKYIMAAGYSMAYHNVDEGILRLDGNLPIKDLRDQIDDLIATNFTNSSTARSIAYHLHTAALLGSVLDSDYPETARANPEGYKPTQAQIDGRRTAQTATRAHISPLIFDGLRQRAAKELPVEVSDARAAINGAVKFLADGAMVNEEQRTAKYLERIGLDPAETNAFDILTEQMILGQLNPGDQLSRDLLAVFTSSDQTSFRGGESDQFLKTIEKYTNYEAVPKEWRDNWQGWVEEFNRKRITETVVALREASVHHQPTRELEIRLGRLFGLPPEADTEKAHETYHGSEAVLTERENIINAFITASTDVPLGHFLLQIPEIHRRGFQNLILAGRELRYHEQELKSSDVEQYRQRYNDALARVDIAIRVELGINALPNAEITGSYARIRLFTESIDRLGNQTSGQFASETEEIIINEIKDLLATRNATVLREYPMYTESLQREVDYLRQKLQAAGFLFRAKTDGEGYEIVRNVPSS